MESLGLLASGVAHDLNNVLSGLVSYPDLLLVDLPKDSPLRNPIETIKTSGLRAAAIVADLLTIARGVAIDKEPLKMNELIEDYLCSTEIEELKRFYPTVVTETSLDAFLFNIIGSEIHFRKIIMNLVSNAFEAIKYGGNILISTMGRYIDKPIQGYEDVKVGEYVILTVSDNGPGISQENLDRIFEPFYSKKIMGRSGTGLGLTVVWNVVQDFNGYIEVKSDENGSVFELYFPVTRDEAKNEVPLRIEDYKGNGETILIVDDQANQREVASAILNKLGYQIKTADSGEKAVEYLKEHSVDLILLDMIMDTGINGLETYKRIIKIHPEQKAVIASGFAETDDVTKAQKLGAGQFIKKPFVLEKIGVAIRDELK
ncbi:MAG: response regulator [Desulfobacteraceae bacterium]|nr:response regulator [Desulfobacteraceae bacterium]